MQGVAAAIGGVYTSLLARDKRTAPEKLRYFEALT
jgi:hypothetical protein